MTSEKQLCSEESFNTMLQLAKSGVKEIIQMQKKIVSGKIIKEIVIASHNEGKVKEIRSLLKPLGFKIYSAKKFKINEPIENGKTFSENSLIKSKMPH